MDGTRVPWPPWGPTGLCVASGQLPGPVGPRHPGLSSGDCQASRVASVWTTRVPLLCPLPIPITLPPVLGPVGRPWGTRVTKMQAS